MDVSEHSLDLLGLPLVDGFPDPDHGYQFQVVAEGATFGVAATVSEIVTSLLADGDLVRVTRFGNREVSFMVQITGPSLGALAHGEAALRAVVGRGGDLVWQPPDAMAVPTAFDVITSSMEFRFDDLGGELRKRRVFLVTLTCLPFGRSVAAVTVPALAAPPASPTTATVTNADTTTGWSAVMTVARASHTTNSSVTPTDEGAYLRAAAAPPLVEPGASPGDLGQRILAVGLTLTYTRAPVVLTATPYLAVEANLPVYAGQPRSNAFSLILDGVSTTLAPALVRANPAGTTTFVFDTGGRSFSGLTIVSSTPGPIMGVTTEVHDISRTDTLLSVTKKQITRVIEVGGTERTPGSIHVQTSSGTGSLGQAIVHTCPEDGSGYSPPLRRWRTSASTGPVTSNAALYSGGSEPISFAVGGFVAEVPTSALPAGGYTLVARVRLLATPPAAVTVFYSTSTIFPGSTDQQGFTNGSQTVTLADTNWALVAVATLSLPSVRTSAGKVQIVLQSSVTHAAVDLDEAWLFREDDDCALTIVDTARPHLWLDSPNANSPVPTVWVGDGSSTRVHPGTGLKAMGSHILSPEGTAVFTAALSDNPATAATFHRRWPTNAAS